MSFLTFVSPVCPDTTTSPPVLLTPPHLLHPSTAAVLSMSSSLVATSVVVVGRRIMTSHSFNMDNKGETAVEDEEAYWYCMTHQKKVNLDFTAKAILQFSWVDLVKIWRKCLFGALDAAPRAISKTGLGLWSVVCPLDSKFWATTWLGFVISCVFLLVWLADGALDASDQAHSKTGLRSVMRPLYAYRTLTIVSYVILYSMPHLNNYSFLWTAGIATLDSSHRNDSEIVPIRLFGVLEIVPLDTALIMKLSWLEP